MALSFGNTVTTDFKRTDSGSGATSLAVDLPSVSAGELLVVVIYHDDNAGTFSTPSGWNSYTGGSVNTVTSFGCTAILWKTAAGGETSVTVSKSGGIGAYIQAHALRITGGHDTTTPINVGSLVDASGGSNWNSPSITTTVNNTLNFWHGGSNGASSWTTGDEPNSSTFIDTGATASSRVMIAYETQTTAGATGTKQFTNTANAKRALSFAIAPAPPPGPTFGNVENTDWKYVDSSVVATSVNVPIPACSAGDLVVIVGYIDSATASFSTPTDFAVGFTGTNAEGGLGIFTKTVTGSEGWGGGSGTVTLSRSGGSDALIQAISLRLTGHDTTTPYNVGAQATAAGGSNWDSPSITTTSNGCILFFGGGSRDVAGTFDVGDEPDTTTLIKQWATSGSWLGLAYETQTTAGATGTRQWTNPTNAKRAFSFAIAPASASGLSISSVTPTDVYSQQVDVAVVGTKLSNSATVTFAGAACTGLSASGSTSLKITMPNFYTNNIKVGTVKELKIIG